MKTIVSLIFFASVASAETKTPTWHESMKEMANWLTELIPDLNRPEVFISQEDKAKVIEKSKKFLGLVHTVKEMQNPPSYDSLVPMISSDLKNQVEEAISLMESGRWSQGSHKMIDISRYCIACHTLKQGPSAPPPYDAKFEHLNAAQRANYFAATRQFDKAMINFETLLSDTKWASTHPEEWNDAFLRLLAISVRVRNNPDLTLELISRFFDSNTYPKNLRTVAKVWREQVKTWRKEDSKGPSLTSLARVKNLVDRAEKLQAKNGDRISFIEFLRASSFLHNYLSLPTNSNNQEALYLAGRASEGLHDQNFWTYAEHYYFRCMSLDAKSAFGKSCTDRLGKLWGNLKK